MAAMNGNGTTVGQGSKVTIGVLLTVIAILVTLLGGYWTGRLATASTIASHCGNVEIHHDSTWLKSEFAQKAVMEQQYTNLKEQLNRIEDKLDKHMTGK